MVLNSQTIRAKENPKRSHNGASQRQAPGINQNKLKNNFLWLFHGYWAGRVYDLCVYYMTGTPEGSTESGFMEKPGIEPRLGQCIDILCCQIFPLGI